jgi:transcriptional regulator with XRE-family HTH domain
LTHGQLVKELCAQHHLKQEELARISGVSHDVISYIERDRRGSVSVLTLFKLEKLLRANGKLINYLKNVTK